jgi:hypothetical protein
VPQARFLPVPDRACPRSLVKLHDDIKEKDYEIEMTWVGSETNGCGARAHSDERPDVDMSFSKHVNVPEALRKEAIEIAQREKTSAEVPLALAA